MTSDEEKQNEQKNIINILRFENFFMNIIKTTPQRNIILSIIK